MESSTNMKILFNEIFQISKGKQKTPTLLESCFKQIIQDNKEDEFIFSVYCFFFPTSTSQEKNTEKKFWYEKYQSSGQYTEYNFALDLLIILKDYLSKRDTKKVEMEIEKITYRLNSYKNVNYYLLLTSGFKVNNLIHLLSFFQKDLKYFAKYFNVEISPTDDLTNRTTLERIFIGETISKKELDIHQFYKNYVKKTSELQHSINKLLEYKENSENLIKEMQEQLEQIHLRDTIKYSIKYIYRMFFQKNINTGEFKNNIYEEIKELKLILSDPKFSKFDYLLTFIEAVQSFDLASLNITAPHIVKNRNFDLIAVYVDNKKPYLKKVVDFLKKLPKLTEYINLEIKHYFSKENLDKEIQKNYDFGAIYENFIEDENRNSVVSLL